MIIRTLFLAAIFSLAFICGCASRMPSSSMQPRPIHSTIPIPVIPCQTDMVQVEIPFKKPMDQGLVVLDPGHGGDDYGTNSSSNPKYLEKNLNMSTALLVKNFLQQFGYTVSLTRYDDRFIALDDRALFANDQNSRIFVSIHYNSAPSKEAEGIEVFYYRSEADKPRSAKSKLLAKSILDKTIKNTGAKSRGIKYGNFAVIRKTSMPAVLIEGGFLTNDGEMEKIKDGSYLKSLSLGIAQGIQDYLAKDKVLKE